MSSIMFTVVLVLYVLVGFGRAQTEISTNLTCDQLPKVPMDNNEKWMTSGPMATFDCSTLTVIPPQRGSTSYTGFAMIVNGDKVTSFHFTVSSDLKSTYTTDSTGRNWTWYRIDADPNGGFHCTYTCDGPALQEFMCSTSNNSEFKQRMENAVALARQVPNGDKIHPAQENCPERKHIVF